MTPASCPFCSGVNLAFLSPLLDVYRVHCFQCHALGPISLDSPEKAVELWNERPNKLKTLLDRAVYGLRYVGSQNRLKGYPTGQEWTFLVEKLNDIDAEIIEARECPLSVTKP